MWHVLYTHTHILCYIHDWSLFKKDQRCFTPIELNLYILLLRSDRVWRLLDAWPEILLGMVHEMSCTEYLCVLYKPVGIDSEGEKQRISQISKIKKPPFRNTWLIEPVCRIICKFYISMTFHRTKRLVYYYRIQWYHCPSIVLAELFALQFSILSWSIEWAVRYFNHSMLLSSISILL